MRQKKSAYITPDDVANTLDSVYTREIHQTSNNISNNISNNTSNEVIRVVKPPRNLEHLTVDIPYPTVKTNAYNTFANAYPQRTDKVYVTFDPNGNKILRDSVYHLERTVDFSIIQPAEIKRINNFSVECFMPNCKGTITKREEVFYGYCSNELCSAIRWFFTPEPWQEHFINNDLHSIFLNVGMFGSAKTTASCAKIIRHMLSIDNAAVLCAAQTLQQLENVGYKTFLQFCPERLIVRKTKSLIELYNGSKIIFVASQDEEKIRGYTLTAAWGIEVDRFKLSFAEQLIQRIRGDNASVFQKDKDGNFIFYKNKDGSTSRKVIWNYNMLILETNPNANSQVINNFYTKADSFISTSHVVDPRTYISFLRPALKGSYKTAVYSSTLFDNPYVSSESRASMEALPPHKKEVYVNCDLSIHDGLVYPNTNLGIVDRFAIPEDWPRIFGGDFGGGSHPTTLVSFAVDTSNPDKYVAYVYDVYSRVDSAPSTHIPAMYSRVYGSLDSVEPKWPVIGLVGDPRGSAKTVGTQKIDGIAQTVFEQYAVRGLPFEPAYNKKTATDTKISGVDVVNDLFKQGQLKVFSDLDLLLAELNTLSYVQKDTIKNGIVSTGKVEVLSPDDCADSLRYGTFKFYEYLQTHKADKPLTTIQTLTRADALYSKNTIRTGQGRLVIATNNSHIVDLKNWKDPTNKVKSSNVGVGSSLRLSRHKKGSW